MAYSADFGQAAEASAVYLTVIPTYMLTALTPGGGTVSVSPLETAYSSNKLVNVTANPAPGWSFLGWQADLTGTSLTSSVVMSRDKTVQALFGTTLSTTTAGNGYTRIHPSSPLYPYGTVVRITAVPGPTRYFGVWGDAASGNTNPLYFAITNLNPTISCLFPSLGANQVSLTVIENGDGRVNVSPRANVYNVGSYVTLTALPNAGQSFLAWTNDAQGTNNPLSVLLDRSEIIEAQFTKRPSLSARPPLEGPTPEGFRFALAGEWLQPYRIDASTNLMDWNSFVVFTNTYGRTQFTDSSANPQGTGTNGGYHRFYRALELR